MFRNILVPIDTDEPAIAEPGVFFSAQLAALTNAAVRMIHVVPPAPSYLHALSLGDAHAHRVGVARDKLLEMAKKANVPTDYFSVTVRSGRVADEVLAEADDWRADLIIVGAHSPSLSAYLLGSNAEKIVRHANCSVMVLRPHKDQHGHYWLFPPIAS